MINATVLIEIVAIGYTAFIWIALFCFPYINFPDDLFNNKAPDLYHYTALLLPLSAIFAYQIGWLVDRISYVIFYNIMYIGKAIKKSHVKQDSFWYVYVYTLCHGDVSAVQVMNQKSAIAKFTRAGFLNSLLIGISIWHFTVNRNVAITVTSICLIASIACFYTFYKTWDHWFRIMAEILRQKKGGLDKLVDPLGDGTPPTDPNYILPKIKIYIGVGIVCLVFLMGFIFSIIKFQKGS